MSFSDSIFRKADYKEEKSEEESDFVYCDTNPVGFVCQSDIECQSLQSVKLGKRTHRQSFLPEDLGAKNKRILKRARKSDQKKSIKKVKKSNDYEISLFDSDIES